MWKTPFSLTGRSTFYSQAYVDNYIVFHTRCEEEKGRKLCTVFLSTFHNPCAKLTAKN